MNLYEIDEYTKELYLNLSHGLELTPDINNGYRGNENGIVYLASYLMMKHITFVNAVPNISFGNQFDFPEIAMNCTQRTDGKLVYGLFNRGANESDIDPSIKRSISKDNISAFSSIAQLFNQKFISRSIYDYGLKHAFIYNNRGVKFDLPMNPGNYALWAYNGQSELFWLLMLPFYLINILISCNKSMNNTSSKILYFIELYPNRDKFIWKSLWKWYKVKMEKQYGKKWLKSLMSIYFLPEHPNVLIADLIEEVK